MESSEGFFRGSIGFPFWGLEDEQALQKIGGMLVYVVFWGKLRISLG